MFTADACDNAAMTVYGGMYPCCEVVKATRAMRSQVEGLAGTEVN